MGLPYTILEPHPWQCHGTEKGKLVRVFNLRQLLSNVMYPNTIYDIHRLQHCFDSKTPLTPTSYIPHMSLRRASPVPGLSGDGQIPQVSTALRAVLDLVSRGPCISSNYSTMLSSQMYDSKTALTPRLL